MGVLGFLGSIFKPAVDLVDGLHTSEEEKQQLKIQLEGLRTSFAARVLEYEEEIAKQKAKVILMESQGTWLQRSWRPITMLVFVGCVVGAGLGVLHFDGNGGPAIPDKMWTLLTVGIGGYVGGRTVEKGIKLWKNGGQSGVRS